MKARTLLTSVSFDPDQIKVLTQAFDEAWVLVAPSVSARPNAIEAARTRLANIILGLARNASPMDGNMLRDESVHLVLAEITKRRPTT